MLTVPASALERARREVRRRLEGEQVQGWAASRDLPSTSAFVDVLSACIDVLIGEVALSGDVATLLRGAALHASFLVLLQSRHGDPDRAATLLVHIWADQARSLGVSVFPDWPPAPLGSVAWTPDDGEHLSMFNLAVGSHLRRATADAQARQAIRRLMAPLT